MKKPIPIACAGILLYFAIAYLSVDIEIDGLQDKYSIGDTIDFSTKVSGIGTTFYSYSIMFETDGGSTTIMGIHRSGPGPSYLDPPYYFTEKITYKKQIDADISPGEYTMKFFVMGHTVQRTIQVLE